MAGFHAPRSGLICAPPDSLQKPVTVLRDYRKTLTTVSPDDSLAAVLALSFENDFSQFPVMAGGRFRAMITENAMIRWLGRRAAGGDSHPDLQSTTVIQVIREEEANHVDRIYQFVRSDTPVDEVMASFALRSMLEAVLLTPNGGSSSAMEGIVTRWDAANYTPARQY